MKTYIVHQVNCMGAFGAGFAKYLASISPKILSDYKAHVAKYDDNRILMGTFHETYINSHLSIIHIFSQYGYGRGKCQTDYDAMRSALENFRKEYPETHCICPYLMGCGLAGGDWNIVEPILKKYRIHPCRDIRIEHRDTLKYVTFVGSREASGEELIKYGILASEYAKRGYTLRSGNAEGFDQIINNAPEQQREIYLPYASFGPKCSGNKLIPSTFSNYHQAVEIVKKLHPNKHLNNMQMQYLARDVYQVLGEDLQTPSEVLYCWTKDGAETIEELTPATGGTAMAIRVALYYHIPIINLKNR